MATMMRITFLLVTFLSLQSAFSVSPPDTSPSGSPDSAPPESQHSSPPSPPAPTPSDPTAAPTPPPATSPSDPPPQPSPASAPAPTNSSDVQKVVTGGGGGLSSSSSGGGGMSTGKKAGIAFGVIAAVAVVGIGGFVYKKRQDNIRRTQYGNAARSQFL